MLMHVFPSNPPGKVIVTEVPVPVKFGPKAVWLLPLELTLALPNSPVLQTSAIVTGLLVKPPVLHNLSVKVSWSVVMSVLLLTVFTSVKAGGAGVGSIVRFTPCLMYRHLWLPSAVPEEL
jgi:hypothetical protein